MKFSKLYVLFVLALAGCSSSDSSNDTGANPVGQNNGAPLSSDTGELLINTANAEQILKDIVSALNLDAIDTMQAQARSMTMTLGDNTAALNGEAPLDGFALTSVTDISSNTEIPYIRQADFSCNPSGNYTQLIYDFNGAPVSQGQFAFNVCALLEAELNGQYEFSGGRRTDGFETFTDLSLIEGDAQQALSGEWKTIFTGQDTSVEFIWTDARYSASGTSSDMLVENMNWRSTGNDSSWPFGNARTGYVQDLNGDPRLVVEFVHSASLQSVFTFSNASTARQTVQADVTLNFSGNYWGWETPANQTSEIPEYSVADLGTPLTLSSAADFTSNFTSVDNVAKSEYRWQRGELTVTATDGSSVTLTPDVNDNSLVNIEVNSSGNITTRSWTDGFDIELPDV